MYYPQSRPASVMEIRDTMNPILSMIEDPTLWLKGGHGDKKYVTPTHALLRARLQKPV